MPRPEKTLRPEDKVTMTRQHSPGSGAPLYSVVCRLFDDAGVEHLHVGMVTNPSQWARWVRHDIDSPPVEVTE